ncbi:iron-containing alcohol dehydrogenase [Mesorhizobium sp. M0843]|uniref:iron-containing alcohol dehydrogenase n=1 Tax=Mesorhizobium sp. M0843 TaxID=2957010 RepID=UPI00333D9F76
MSRQMLDRLIAGTLPDPDSQGMLSVPLKTIVIGRGLGDEADALVKPLPLGRKLAVVMDPDTRLALGERVSIALRGSSDVGKIILPRHPHPDMDAVRSVIARTKDASGLVAVGSGSINDITKYAAHLTQKPYAVFGTAPSMNGYTSVSAAITEDGLKKSLTASLPVGVFLDLDVMARAPHRLIAAGFGDSMARPTAQTDWLMAHLLLGTPYREAPFMLLAEDEEALIAKAGELGTGDLEAMEVLVRTLVMSGLGMTLCGGSYPASQGEHLIAHYIDMRGQGLPETHHGEHIAVTTLTMARLQERVLALRELQLAPSADTPDRFIEIFGETLGRSCWAAFKPKLLDRERANAINTMLAKQWRSHRERLVRVARPAREIAAALRAAGAPTTPQEVAIPAGFYDEAVANARLIRDRFTMLDVAAASLETVAAGA